MVLTYSTGEVLWIKSDVMNHKTAQVSHPYDVLELFVVLQLFFVVADSLSVVTAEISIAVLHPLAYFTRKLEARKDNCHRTTLHLCAG